jgi:hypothetical protein
VQQRPLPAPEQPAAIEPAEQAPLRPAAFRTAAAQRPPEPARAPVAPPPAAAMPPARPAAPPPPAPPRVQREVAVEGAEDDIAKPKAAIDPLYADIERKLGEALSRAPSSPPTAPPPPPARASAPPPSFERPAPSFSRPATPTPPPAPARPAAPPPLRRPEPAAAPAAKDTGSKSHLDALEEEMASLLGRDRSS